MNDIINEIFQLSEKIRCVAVYIDGELESYQRDGISESSSPESDKYEEILVNPTILKIANQRGNIDCGGTKFVIIRYGNFYQLLKEIRNGHVSICIEPEQNSIEIEKELDALLNKSYLIVGGDKVYYN